MARIIFQVAHALNCPTTTDSDLALCLRGQDVNTLLDVKIHKPKYVPAFAPLIDNAVIPDEPQDLMKNAQLLGRYEKSASRSPRDGLIDGFRFPQVRLNVRRDGVGEVSHFTTGRPVARDAGRTEGRGSQGPRHGMRREAWGRRLAER